MKKVQGLIHRSHLSISDLNYLHWLNYHPTVVGGTVLASTYTTTTTGIGYATADAGTLAIGETTYSDALAKTSLEKFGIVTLSSAEAKATAYARTRSETALSQSSFTSILFVVTSH